MSDVQTSTVSSLSSQILGLLFIALIVLFLVNRNRKKKGKEPFHIFGFLKKTSARKTSASVTETVTETSRGSGRWYGNYEKLITVDAFKKVADKTYVVFDLETTGLDADYDAIVEIGAVRVSHGKIVDEYHQIVNPLRPMPAKAASVNHITDDMLRDAPEIREVLPGFLSFVGGDVLVAHNGGFDASFLDNACSRCGLAAPRKYFDTMRLSVYWPHLENRKLATFLKAAGIKNDQAHRSLSDARATAELCIVSMQKIR